MHERRVGDVGLGKRVEAEVGDDARSEVKAVGRAAELEVAEFVALGHVMPRRDVGVDDAGGDVGHSDGHERPSGR